MKKRLTLALAAGALVAAMLPGVTSATDPACEVTDPSLVQVSQCVDATSAQLKVLFKEVNDTTKELQKKITEIQKAPESLSIGDMYEMQLLMNHLVELSQTIDDVVSASNTSIQSMARNVKS